MDSEDPFNESQEPLQLGMAYYRLEGLAFLMDNPTTVSIIGQNSAIMGKIDINVVPVDQDGESEVPDDMIPESPDELVGQRIDFKVIITKAQDLPQDFCKDIYCEYSFFLGEERYSTPVVQGKNRSPEFNYSFHHTIEPCTEYFIQYLQKESLCVKVYGFPDLKVQEEKAPKKVGASAAKKKKESSKSKGGNDSTRDMSQNSSYESSSGGVQDFNVVTKKFLQEDNFITEKNMMKKQKNKEYEMSGSAQYSKTFNQKSLGASSIGGKKGNGGQDDKDCRIF